MTNNMVRAERGEAWERPRRCVYVWTALSLTSRRVCLTGGEDGVGGWRPRMNIRKNAAPLVSAPPRTTVLFPGPVVRR